MTTHSSHLNLINIRSTNRRNQVKRHKHERCWVGLPKCFGSFSMFFILLLLRSSSSHRSFEGRMTFAQKQKQRLISQKGCQSIWKWIFHIFNALCYPVWPFNIAALILKWKMWAKIHEEDIQQFISFVHITLLPLQIICIQQSSKSLFWVEEKFVAYTNGVLHRKYRILWFVMTLIALTHIYEYRNLENNSIETLCYCLLYIRRFFTPQKVSST